MRPIRVRLKLNLQTALLAVTCIAALAALTFSINQSNGSRRPVWEPYTANSLKKALDQNRFVLITLSADWDPNTRVHDVVFQNEEVGRMIHKYRYMSFRADATYGDAATKQLMNENNLRNVPAVLLYNPTSRTRPIILENFVLEEELLAALRQNVVRSL